MDYKDGKWAKQIIQSQHDDGSWGYFHSLANPSLRKAITTEQALRRLEILGFTKDDKPIKKAINYMHKCLCGEMELPDYKEKIHNWELFTELMLGTWIRVFTEDDRMANGIVDKWAEIINSSFEKKHITILSIWKNIKPFLE
ncbi:hypothetical protein K7I13_03010 [Brucepastera parasyntrophica]|uniref:hypothetical protein n=1 Tax=Brucepastera parasyntrophica TaxID=2880008 RepID=UPI00210A6082|nr:hypothetical protein [Brucepastera parasyntrophica]ULQ60295.1 hypothetical protein K7I13_03010 [Brucepastera parasyntrophica]